MSKYLVGVNSDREFFDYLELVASEGRDLALDIETVEDVIIGVGFGDDKITGYFTKSDVRTLIPYILEVEQGAPLVMHSGGSDVKGLRRSFEGIPMLRVWDTMVAARLVNEPELNLEYLAWAVNSPIVGGSFSKLTKQYKAKDLEGVPEEVVAEYNMSQVQATYKLKSYYEPRIDKNYFDMEMQILHILIQMEEAGVMIDAQRLAKLREMYSIEAEATQTAISVMTHGGIDNVNSVSQVRMYIYDVLGHSVIYRTPKGEPSTDERTLRKIMMGKHGEEFNYRVLKPILHVRQLRKLVGTYCDGLAASLDGASRSHTEFSQVSVDTGRLSSREPNHQNIPKRRGPEIRRCFVAPERFLLIAADMDQLELRIIAEEAGEGKMLDVFRAGGDIHQQVADELGIPRFPAKILNYTIVYMAGPQQIADQIEAQSGVRISKAKAEMWQQSYFRKYRALSSWINSYGNMCVERGYTLTWMGRRRDLAEFWTPGDPNWKKAEAVRKAVNTRIQGTAAEIMKLNMIKVEKYLREGQLSARQIIQIHDEILIEAPEDEVPLLKITLKSLMRHMHGSLELPTTVKVGKNWGDVK